jgi:hypothetical protein
VTDLNKLDSNAKYLLSEYEQSGEEKMGSVVNIMLRGRMEFTPDQLQELRSMGVQVRTISGDVLAAETPLTTLAGLSDLDFVVSVAVSRPLFYEDPDQPSGFLSDVE